ncbi:hypothetical protein [Pontibacter cellulosilyticus]|uniref:Uncharacterized protein n=1 Tax=Pontibacter cellulosilyticus TaxID=1720253 RepID=A0A923SK96_9BACT|nr:hypothetical protein [Pontibacter cellulosilyticus]MBC5994704.1 hypothetical protein [Pontibacter cellulosilyticus]
MISTTQVDLAFLSVSFQQEMGIFFCRWNNKVNLHQFTEGYYTSLEVAKQHESGLWLHDIRKRDNSDKLKATWFLITFMPYLEQAISKPVLIAYLMSPHQKELLLTTQQTQREEEVLS